MSFVCIEKRLVTHWQCYAFGRRLQPRHVQLGSKQSRYTIRAKVRLQQRQQPNAISREPPSSEKSDPNNLDHSLSYPRTRSGSIGSRNSQGLAGEVGMVGLLGLTSLWLDRRILRAYGLSCSNFFRALDMCGGYAIDCETYFAE